MAAERLLDEIGQRQGWNDQSKLALCLQYIENQQADDAFEDFLKEQAHQENLYVADLAALLAATNPAAENEED